MTTIERDCRRAWLAAARRHYGRGRDHRPIDMRRRSWRWRRALRLVPILFSAGLSLSACGGPQMDTACFFHIWAAGAANKETAAEHWQAIRDAQADCRARYAAGR